uniref:Uncharacterized protein ORF-c21_010 n=1 Tax=Saccharolobus solfataricus TaxID=2287 RepID=Q9UWZ2_SACSO|nr:hypothetical protein [Saccharolobus solfataricus P2]
MSFGVPLKMFRIDLISSTILFMYSCSNSVSSSIFEPSTSGQPSFTIYVFCFKISCHISSAKCGANGVISLSHIVKTSRKTLLFASLPSALTMPKYSSKSEENTNSNSLTASLSSNASICLVVLLVISYILDNNHFSGNPKISPV